MNPIRWRFCYEAGYIDIMIGDTLSKEAQRYLETQLKDIPKIPYKQSGASPTAIIIDDMGESKCK